MRKLVLDTSVLVDYIVLRSPYRTKVAKLINKASTGKLELYINAVTLSETLYVTSRIYQAAGAENPNREATDFIDWIKNRAKTVNVNEDIALRAGELKKQLYIALPDCYVISTAEAINATPVFKKVEDEMKSVIEKIRKLNIKFLDEMEF